MSDCILFFSFFDFEIFYLKGILFKKYDNNFVIRNNIVKNIKYDYYK